MKIFRIYQRYMLRPLLYMAAKRLMLALIFLLALVRFVPDGPAPNLIAGFLTVLFALLAYFVYLRMDGLRIPRMKYLQPRRKDPLRNYADMADHTDDAPPVSFDELEEDERDFISLMANVLNLVIFLVLSFVLN